MKTLRSVNYFDFLCCFIQTYGSVNYFDVLTFFIKLKGHSGFFCCYDAPEVLQKRGSIVGNISCSSGGINSEAETPRRNGQGVVASTGIDNNEPL